LQIICLLFCFSLLSCTKFLGNENFIFDFDANLDNSSLKLGMKRTDKTDIPKYENFKFYKKVKVSTAERVVAKLQNDILIMWNDQAWSLRNMTSNQSFTLLAKEMIPWHNGDPFLEIPEKKVLAIGTVSRLYFFDLKANKELFSYDLPKRQGYSCLPAFIYLPSTSESNEGVIAVS